MGMNELRKQLELSKEDIEAIGFIEQHAPADSVEGITSPARTWYAIPVTNAEFIYNVGQGHYKWYFRTKIGECYNSNHLDIAKLPELYVVLSSFQAKFNMRIFN